MSDWLAKRTSEHILFTLSLVLEIGLFSKYSYPKSIKA